MGKQIVIVGEFFSPNLGDGVIFDCMKYLFQQHDINSIPLDLSGRREWIAEQSVFAHEHNVGIFRKLARIPVRRSLLLRRLISAVSWYGWQRRKHVDFWREKISSSDAVIIGGGQLLTDITFGFPPKIYEIVRIAKLYKKPVAFFGCGVSESWGYTATKLYGSAMRYAQYISVRDTVSAANLEKHLKFKLAVSVHPDPGFVVRSAYSNPASVSNAAEIGFNIMSINIFRKFVPGLQELSDKAYCDFWIKMVRGANNSGRSVKFITNGDYYDHFEAHKTVGKLKASGLNVILEQRAERPEQLIEQLTSVPELVCTRMHAGIIAFGFGKRVVPISWNKKVDGVWNSVGLDSRVQPADIINADDPWKNFEALLAPRRIHDTHLKTASNSIADAVSDCVRALTN